MRVGVVLSPTGNWPAILEAARIADTSGLDAVGFWDHYHSEQPEWSYVCGWSAYGFIAATTQRIRLVPMVLARLNYTLGVLAKESSILSIASGGRFELGIGAGDYPVEYTAWHQPYPDALSRIAALRETILALREIWKGGLVNFEAEHVRLTNAACTPSPSQPPRIVVGVGSSRRLIRDAVGYADELNVYADEDVLRYAREQIAGSGRTVEISVYRHIDWDKWPSDLPGELRRWEDLDVGRLFVNIGFDADLVQRVSELAGATARL
jgi:alkanesulfonate monooxygenase SsuD/methylene tetrahydromethanopterin reductase-like flavin-dependent oxidoreductase (luciferase family)